LNIIITCGKKKIPQKAKAIDLYTGSYFIAMRDWARIQVEKDENIYILSARYGLINAETEIEPYEQKLGEVGSVSRETVKNQLSDEITKKEIWFVGGKAYKDFLIPLIPNLKTLPAFNQMGMFDQISFLKKITKNNVRY
jgi:hypothetical protein